VGGVSVTKSVCAPSIPTPGLVASRTAAPRSRQRPASGRRRATNKVTRWDRNKQISGRAIGSRPIESRPASICSGMAVWLDLAAPDDPIRTSSARGHRFCRRVASARAGWKLGVSRFAGSLPRAACVKVVLQHDQTVQKLTNPRPPHRRKRQYNSIFIITAGEY
jgi:hypothetical protein